MLKKHNKDHRCNHGYKLWWNFGDGKARHISENAEPLMVICNDIGEEHTHE